MLFMLMFLGLLPATLAHGDGGNDDRDTGPGPAAGDTGAAAAGQDEAAAPGDLLDLPEAEDGAGLDDPLLDPDGGADDADVVGEVVHLDADSGDVSIAGFQPGIDRLEVQLGPDESRFESVTDPDSGAPGLLISGAPGSDGQESDSDSGEDDDRLILFPGLQALPVDDILLTRDGAEGLAVFRLQDLAGSEPILPLPTDGEEVVTPAEAEDGAALTPLDPEAEETVTPAAPEPDGPALTPLPGDGEEVITPAAAQLTPTAPEPPATPTPDASETSEPREAA